MNICKLLAEHRSFKRSPRSPARSRPEISLNNDQIPRRQPANCRAAWPQPLQQETAMNTRMASSLSAILALTASVFMVTAPAQAAVPADLAALVNPLIGTLKEGNTFPGASLPFGMVQVSPDTGYETGYKYDSPKILGFSNTHLSGAGCGNATEVSLMPTLGGVRTSDPNIYGQPLNHANEQASAGTYKVSTPNGVTTELTSTLRTGWQRYTFPSSTEANVLFNTAFVKGANAKAVRSSISIVNGDTVEGSVTTSGFCSSTPEHTVYFSAKFNRPFASFGTWSGTTFTNNSRNASGSSATGGWVRFDTTSNRSVTVKLGISYTGLAGARSNLSAETSAVGFAFDTVRKAAVQAWNDQLHKAEIDGGTWDRQVAYYTSLYHALLSPNLAGDVDGSYRGFDNQVHKAADYTPYQTFSLWDTYRAQNQLVALLLPKVARDYALSLLAIDREWGWLPRWSMYYTETNTMTGDPVTPFLVDLWSRGLLNGYEQAFYAALRKNAVGVPPAALKLNSRNGNPSYTSLGYIATDANCGTPNPIDNDCGYPASATLEYAVADSALAIMAAGLGHTADAELFNSRGQAYRKLFDPAIGFFRPKNASGAFITPYNPADGAHKFHEGGAYQYQWLVPQDPAGLIDLLGGKSATNNRLDSFFAYSDLLLDPAGTAQTKWVNGSYDYYSFTTYNPNNEPDLLAPYMYLYTGQPSKTSTVVRAAYTLFSNQPHGMTGNDDLGTMSAWYVLSSLGIYPLMNGTNTYGVVTPQFPWAKVSVGSYGTHQGGTLNITAPSVSDSNRYIGSATLNGTAFSKTWLSHADIAKGATLQYAVASTASNWGTGPNDAPPSANHATPPAGSNLALGRPATGTAACSATEGPDKAVNGSVSGGNADKFCSVAVGSWLQVDLGSAKSVTGFVVRHAGAGSEPMALNTKAFTLQLSADGAIWSTPVTVTANTASISTHLISTTTARYARLNVQTPSQTADGATRIYEFEVYGNADAGLLRGVESNRCLDIPLGNTANGTLPFLWDCDAGNPNQQWAVTAAGELRALGKCLDVQNSATANGTALQVWDCSGGPNQKFTLQGDGSIKAVASGRCLDLPGHATANGTKPALWTCNGGTNQKFTRN